MHPAARAGATFHDASVTGAFHGTIAATTPTGRELTRAARSPETTGRSNSNDRIRDE